MRFRTQRQWTNQREIDQRREHVKEREGGLGKRWGEPQWHLSVALICYIIRDVGFAYESHQC